MAGNKYAAFGHEDRRDPIDRGELPRNQTPPQVTPPEQDAPVVGIPAAPPVADVPGTEAPPTAAPPTVDRNQDADQLAADLIGDIPPPPVPAPPAPVAPIKGPGVGGIPGTEAGTLSQPGTPGAMPFHTPAFAGTHTPRFGPGTPVVGGDPAALGDALPPEIVAEILRSLAAGRSTPQ
jgi:hypothetical protein